jgi:hypothetical protein
MALGSILTLAAFSSQPSPPPGGFLEMYIVGTTLYLQDSSGNIYPFASTTSISQLTGDVSAIGPGSAVATVNSVGGQSASNIAAATVAYGNATSAATPSTLVLRDGSANFSANIITASLNGNATTATNATNAITAINFTGSLSGDVTGTQSATVVSFVGGVTAANVASGANLANGATALNSPSTIVRRDGSGNFAAGTITANLTGNATNVTGIVAIANGGTNSSTALNNNRIIISHTGQIVEASAITANQALISNGIGIPIASVTTATELGYVSGVTSSIQTQINAISGSAITQLTGDVTAVGPGSAAATIASIQGKTVSGTTGTTNVVFSNAPTLTGLLSGSSAIFSSTVTASNLSGTNTGDVTTTNTNSINLAFTSGQTGLNATLNLSASGPDAGYIPAFSQIKSDGLLVEVLAGTPVQIGTSNNIGSAASAARSDHVHAISSTTVLGLLLTGYVTGTNTPINATNTILQGFENLQAQVSATGGSAITSLTGDVTATGPGAAAATVVALQGSAISNTAPTDAQILIWVNGTSKWTPTSVSGDATISDSGVLTFATVNGNVGAFGSSTSIPSFTVNAKGLITAASSNVVIAPAGTLTGTTLASNVVTSSLTSVGTITSGVWNGTPLSAAYMLALPTAEIYVGNGSNQPAAVTVTGDISISSSGVVTLATVNSSPGTFGSSTAIPSLTVNAKGLITAIITDPVIAPAGTLTGTTLASNVVNSSLTSVGTITSGVWNGTPLTAPYMLPLPNADIYVGNVSNQPAAVTVSGDIAITNSGATTIQTNVVSNSKLAQAPANTLKGNNTGSTANVTDLTTSQVVTLLGAITALTGDVTASGPGSASATVTALQGHSVSTTAPTDAQLLIWIGSATNKWTPASMSGDSTISDTGTLTLATVNSNVGSFGSSTAIPSFTVNAKGLITAASSSAVIAPAGTLTGTTLASNVVNSSLQNLGTQNATLNMGNNVLNNALAVEIGTTGAAGGGLIVANATTFNAASATGLDYSGGASRLISWGPTTSTFSPIEFLQVTSNSSSNRAPIYASAIGQVGIGNNTNPAYALDVSGTFAADTHSIFTDGSGNMTLNSLTVNNNIGGSKWEIFGSNGHVSFDNAAITSNGSGILTVADLVVTASSTTAITANTTAFVVDSTNNVLGIGVQPATTVMIDGVNTTLASKLIQMTGYGVGSNTGYRGRFARGTSGTPAAVQAGDILNTLSGRGYGTSQFATASTGVINVVANETFTNTSNQTYLQFSVTPTASVTSAEHMRVAATGVTLGPQSASTDLHTVNGGWLRTNKTITSSYSIDTTTSDDILYCNQSAGITITLPAPTSGRTIVIKDISGSAQTNNITVAQHAAEKIENLAASKILQTNFGSWTFSSDSVNWWLI